MPVFVALLTATLLDLAVLLAVGQAIGVGPTVLLLLLGALLGVALIRREGRRTLAAFGEAVLTGRMPHREMADGVLIAAAGVLILLPGLVSDALALTLLLPPTRSFAREWMVRRAERGAGMRDRSGPFVVDAVVVDAHEEDGTADRGRRGSGGPAALPGEDEHRRPRE